ncbi:tripartite motif-containing protein 45-like [Mytilus californianus]|uniref:tripartite motif-containing protein 45-like n=1 Tax=Mytilus californianus TaxID=6549 RepID=UPI0022485A42|nr:tripartite motif-containing protein 45-like [Mytilus californianus]
MASKNLLCGTCDRRSRTTEAVKYCTDCQEGLCSECLDFHGSMKSSTSHHVIDIHAVDGIGFNISKFCKVHPDMVLEYFCSDHDALCCRSCMVSDHRSCDKILPIEVAAKDVKISTIYEEIVTDVRMLNAAVNGLEDKKEKSVYTIDDSKVAVQQEVQYFQKRLQTRIQEIAVALMCEIDKVHTELSDKAKSDMNKICDRKNEIRNISEQFESVSKHGSESQIFMLINSMKEELNCHVNEFQEFLSSQKAASLLYKESDLLSVMKSFGSVEIKETPFDIKYKPFKAQKAQFLQQQRKLPTKFQLDTKFKVPGANVIGISVTKDNRLFLCDRTGSKLFVMSDKGKQLAAIRMDGRQWGIAMDEDKHTAWVTLPDTPCVQTVDIVKMEKGRLIKVPGVCYGIALIDDEIAVGGYGKIYIISKTGDLKKTCN